MSPGQVGVERIPPTLPGSCDVVLADGTSLGQLLGLLRPRGRNLSLLRTLWFTLRLLLLRLPLGALRLVQDQLHHLPALELLLADLALLLLLRLLLVLLLHQIVQVDILRLVHLIDSKVPYNVFHPQLTEESEQLESVVLLGEITPGN